MALELVSLVLGFTVLAVGASLLVRGGASLARRLGLSPLVIGLTVVAFGTSAPEMVVSVRGAFKGYGDIALGNVVGSNIFNVGVILALAAMIAPIRVKLGLLKLDAPFMVG
ncbi:MAG: sodium:calcium antiporter, partial [Deltaproteobacteria bacterium]|nr:sodium:calcium antiporter [Deltaproteobacteria bacterium]